MVNETTLVLITFAILRCSNAYASVRTLVQPDEGFNDEPSMVVVADGSLYVSWVSFRDGFDSLQLAHYRFESGHFQQDGAWQLEGGKQTIVEGPQLVKADNGVYVLYAKETGRNWDVFAVPCDSNGPGRPVQVSSNEDIDWNVAGEWHDGYLWVAWEASRKGKRRIMARRLHNGQWGREEELSAPGYSNYEPSIAVTSTGQLTAAWHSFRRNNYDIYYRSRGGSAAWGPEKQLTDAPGIDRHAHVFAHGPETWIAWENSWMEGYYIGRNDKRRTMLARLDASGPQSIEGYFENNPLLVHSEGARTVFDSAARLWVSFLVPTPKRDGWQVHLTSFDGKSWTAPEVQNREKGLDRAPSIAQSGQYVFLAWQADDFPRSYGDANVPGFVGKPKSAIWLAAIERNGGAVSKFAMNALAQPYEPVSANQLRVLYGEDRATPSIAYEGKRLNLYYGDLHAHSDISPCVRHQDQSVEEGYQTRRDYAHLDFVAMTDHGYSFIPYLWAYTGKMARINEDRGSYLTFLAEEWTSSFEKTSAEHPYGYYGHRNLIFSDLYFPRWWSARNGDTPAELWRQLGEMKADYVTIPHQLADTQNVPVDWNFVDEQRQPVAEIYQHRGSYEYAGAPLQASRSTPGGRYFLQDAWARGIVIGVIASPDHWGGTGKACVFAPSLNRQDILDALRKRHTFGTTTARMLLDFRVNGKLMGAVTEHRKGEAVDVRVAVRCPGAIDKVEICRNNRFIYAQKPDGNNAEFTFRDTEPLTGRSYYYMRVTQQDGEMGWTSPVWIDAR